MKKRLVLISSLTSLAVITVAVTGLAIGKNASALSRVKAGENEYQVVINRDTIRYSGIYGHYVLTPKGNMITFSVTNGEFFDTDDEEYQALIPNDALCFIRGNGAGMYFYDPIQKVDGITTTFAFSDAESSNRLTINLDTTSGGFEHPFEITNMSGDQYVSSDTDDRYITYWYTNSDNTTEETKYAYIKSIVINYTCS